MTLRSVANQAELDAVWASVVAGDIVEIDYNSGTPYQIDEVGRNYASETIFRAANPAQKPVFDTLQFGVNAGTQCKNITLEDLHCQHNTGDDTVFMTSKFGSNSENIIWRRCDFYGPTSFTQNGLWHDGVNVLVELCYFYGWNIALVANAVANDGVEVRYTEFEGQYDDDIRFGKLGGNDYYFHDLYSHDAQSGGSHRDFAQQEDDSPPNPPTNIVFRRCIFRTDDATSNPAIHGIFLNSISGITADDNLFYMGAADGFQLGTDAGGLRICTKNTCIATGRNVDPGFSVGSPDTFSGNIGHNLTGGQGYDLPGGNPVPTYFDSDLVPTHGDLISGGTRLYGTSLDLRAATISALLAGQLDPDGPYYGGAPPALANKPVRFSSSPSGRLLLPNGLPLRF